MVAIEQNLPFRQWIFTATIIAWGMVDNGWRSRITDNGHWIMGVGYCDRVVRVPKGLSICPTIPTSNLSIHHKCLTPAMFAIAPLRRYTVVFFDRHLSTF